MKAKNHDSNSVHKEVNFGKSDHAGRTPHSDAAELFY